MKFVFQFPIGDWSKDGHNRSKNFYFKSNKKITDIRKAYKKSCKKLGIQFNDTDWDQNYTSVRDLSKERRIWTNFGSNEISQEAIKILINAGIDVKKINPKPKWNPKLATILVLEFIKLSMPSLKYKPVELNPAQKKDLPCLNGYWQSSLNVHIGYGLFNVQLW